MKSKLNAKQLAMIFSIVYFASYVTRINFAAIIQSVVSDTGYLKSDLSLVLVVLSITYGIGQIINGIISDTSSRYPMFSLYREIVVCTRYFPELTSI